MAPCKGGCLFLHLLMTYFLFRVYLKVNRYITIFLKMGPLWNKEKINFHLILQLFTLDWQHQR